MDRVAPFFPIFFLLLAPLVMRIIAGRGWDRLAAHFRYDAPFEGKRIGVISPGVNEMGYRNCIVLWVGKEGFYLKPLLVFRLFHPPLLIPWREVHSVRDKKVLFSKLKELTIGYPSIARLLLEQKTFTLLEGAARAAGRTTLTDRTPA